MNYFKPNWKAINKAITAEGDRKSLRELREEQNRISKLIQKKIDENLHRKIQAEKHQHIKSLQSLPVDTPLYFSGTYSNMKHLFGLPCTKKKDGRTRISIVFQVAGSWSVPYESVQTEPLSQSQITSGKVKLRITDIFNNVL